MAWKPQKGFVFVESGEWGTTVREPHVATVCQVPDGDDDAPPIGSQVLLLPAAQSFPLDGGDEIFAVAQKDIMAVDAPSSAKKPAPKPAA